MPNTCAKKRKIALVDGGTLQPMATTCGNNYSVFSEETSSYLRFIEHKAHSKQEKQETTIRGKFTC